MNGSESSSPGTSAFPTPLLALHRTVPRVQPRTALLGVPRTQGAPLLGDPGPPPGPIPARAGSPTLLGLWYFLYCILFCEFFFGLQVCRHLLRLPPPPPPVTATSKGIFYLDIKFQATAGRIQAKESDGAIRRAAPPGSPCKKIKRLQAD